MHANTLTQCKSTAYAGVWRTQARMHTYAHKHVPLTGGLGWEKVGVLQERQSNTSPLTLSAVEIEQFGEEYWLGTVVNMKPVSAGLAAILTRQGETSALTHRHIRTRGDLHHFVLDSFHSAWEPLCGQNQHNVTVIHRHVFSHIVYRAYILLLFKSLL